MRRRLDTCLLKRTVRALGSILAAHIRGAAAPSSTTKVHTHAVGHGLLLHEGGDWQLPLHSKPTGPEPPPTPTAVHASRRRRDLHEQQELLVQQGRDDLAIVIMSCDRLATACHAGAHEASGNQRILTAVSADGARPAADTWSDWTAVAPQPAGLDWARWEPTLFLTPDNRFVFYSEGLKSMGPYLHFAVTALVDVSSGAVGMWSASSVIMNTSDRPRTSTCTVVPDPSAGHLPSGRCLAHTM